MALSPAGGVVVAAGAAVTLLALVRLVVLRDAATEAADGDGAPDGAATARVDRIVAGILLGVLGLLLIVLGFLLG